MVLKDRENKMGCNMNNQSLLCVGQLIVHITSPHHHHLDTYLHFLSPSYLPVCVLKAESRTRVS